MSPDQKTQAQNPCLYHIRAGTGSRVVGKIALFWDVCALCEAQFNHTSYDIEDKGNGQVLLHKRERKGAPL